MGQGIRVANKEEIKMSIGIHSIGFILVIMAGWIDTVGVKLFLNESPAFMTGRGLILGYWVFKWDFQAFMGVLVVIFAFILGACFSTFITRKTGLIGGLITTGILVMIASLPICLKNITIDSILVPMAMGCQNAATSLTAISRTTHLTGPATDIGINIAKGHWRKVGFWMFRWIGFPLGSVIGFNLVHMASKGMISVSLTLLIPGMIIMMTGIVQKRIFNIPLLEEDR